MKQLMIKPAIYKYAACDEFVKAFNIGKGDLVNYK